MKRPNLITEKTENYALTIKKNKFVRGIDSRKWNNFSSFQFQSRLLLFAKVLKHANCYEIKKLFFVKISSILRRMKSVKCCFSLFFGVSPFWRKTKQKMFFSEKQTFFFVLISTFDGKKPTLRLLCLSQCFSTGGPTVYKKALNDMHKFNIHLARLI